MHLARVGTAVLMHDELLGGHPRMWRMTKTLCPCNVGNGVVMARFIEVIRGEAEVDEAWVVGMIRVAKATML